MFQVWNQKCSWLLRCFTSTNLYFMVIQPTRICFFLSHATVYGRINNMYMWVYYIKIKSNWFIAVHFYCHVFYHSYYGWLRNPAPVDRWFIQFFSSFTGFKHVSTILLVILWISQPSTVVHSQSLPSFITWPSGNQTWLESPSWMKVYSQENHLLMDFFAAMFDYWRAMPYCIRQFIGYPLVI